MAVVVSNRDKDKVELSKGDEIFLFKEENAGVNATPAKLVQNNSYPLVILDITRPEPQIEPAPALASVMEEASQPTSGGDESAGEAAEEPISLGMEDAVTEVSMEEAPAPALYGPEDETGFSATGLQSASSDFRLTDLEDAPAAHPVAAEEEEETVPPLFEMDLGDEEGIEDEVPAAQPMAAEEEEENVAPPLVEMDFPDDDSERTPLNEPFDIETGQLISPVSMEGGEGDFGLVDTSSELLMIPPLPGTDKAELGGEAAGEEEGMDQTPLMDSVGEEYEKTQTLEGLDITDDYLNVTQVEPETGEDDETDPRGDGSIEIELEETGDNGAIDIPGAIFVEPVSYLGVEDITSSESAETEWRDETPSPTPDFFIPEGEAGEAPEEARLPTPEARRAEPEESLPMPEAYMQPELPPTQAEPSMPEAYMQPELPPAPMERFDAPEPAAGGGISYLAPDMEEDLEATSPDVYAGDITMDDIEILDEDLKDVPSLEDSDLDSDMGAPKPLTALEEEAEEAQEELEEWSRGYPAVTHFPDMELAQEREFHIEDLDKLLAKPRDDEEEETGEPVTIAEEGKKYAFDEDMEDTVKILAPFGGDDTLGGFTIDDLKDFDDATPRPLVEPSLLAGEEAPMFEMDLSGDGREDEPHAQSFGSTTKIPKPDALRMVSPGALAGGGVFEDYFGFRYAQAGPETVSSLKAAISQAPTGRRRGAAPLQAGGVDIAIQDSVGKDVRDALVKIMEKVSALEKMMVAAPAGPPAPTGDEPTAICVSINSTGLMAAIDGNPPPAGKPLYVMIDRPWDPTLRVDALAELISSEKKGDNIHICYLRFTSIHEKDKDAIDDYLARSSTIIEKIKRALRH